MELLILLVSFFVGFLGQRKQINNCDDEYYYKVFDPNDWFCSYSLTKQTILYTNTYREIQ